MSEGVLAEELKEAGRELGRRLMAGGGAEDLEAFAAAVLKALSGDPGALATWFSEATDDWLPDIPGFDPLGNFLTSLSSLDASKIVGILSGGLIPDLDAAKIVTGFFDLLRIPDLPASKTTSGSFGDARIPGLDVSKIVSGVFGDGFIPSLAASKITSGVLNILRVPDLDAGKITSGAFAQTMVTNLTSDLAARLTALSNLDATKLINSIDILRIPGLPASQITSGAFAQSMITNLTTDLAARLTAASNLDATKLINAIDILRLPNLPASQITSGSFAQSMVTNLTTDLAARLTAASSLDATKLAGLIDILRIPDLSASKITSGAFAQSMVTNLTTDLAARLTAASSLDATKLAGLIDVLRIPDLDAAKITSGTMAQARIASLVTDLAARLTSASTLNSANLSGVLGAGLIPDLDVAKITTGIFNILRVPDLDANKITSGQLPATRIVDLDAAKITSGQLPATRLADLDAAKIVSGTMAQARVANLGTDLGLKAAASIVQDIIDLGVQGATGASTPPTGQTVPDLRDALNVLTGRTVSAEASATNAQGYLSALLAENNAAASGGISKSVNFVGTNGAALSSTDWTTYLGNTTPSSTYLVIKNNNAAITAGTTDGTYRPHAVLKTQFTTDNQSVSAVHQESGSGLIYSNETYLVLRSNAAMTLFTYAKIFGTGGSTPRQISIGYGSRSGTTFTFNDQTTITSPFVGPGAVIEFRVDGNLYEVRVNSNSVLQWPDSSSVTNRGATFRYAGFIMTWSRAFFVNYFGPELSQFSISDYAGSGVKGIGFRFNRTNTAAVTFGNLTGNGVKSPNGFYGIQQASANIPIIAASEGLIKTPYAGWWIFEVNYLMGAAVATSNVVYAGIWTGLSDPPLSIFAKTTGGAGTGSAIDQHIGGTIGPIYLEKDTYVAPCMWAIDTTSRSAKGGTLANDCSFAGYLKSGA